MHFDLNPGNLPSVHVELPRLDREAWAGVSPAQQNFQSAADAEVEAIQHRAANARKCWEAAEVELRQKSGTTIFARLPSLERRLRLPSALDLYGRKTPAAVGVGQRVNFDARGSSAAEYREASSSSAKNRSSSALSFLTPSLRHLEKVIPDELRAKLAMYRSDSEQLIALEERVAFYDSQRPQRQAQLGATQGFVERNKELVQGLSPNILLEERRKKLHEHVAHQRQCLERARQRRLLQLEGHHKRLREAVARFAKEANGPAMAVALGRPLESGEQQRKRVTLERQDSAARAWRTLVAFTSRLSFLAEKVQEHRADETKRKRLAQAARTIQVWYRAWLIMQQQERRNQSARIIQRNFRRWAFVHGIRARQRNASAILSFLRSVSHANMVTSAFRVFRGKVITIQVACVSQRCLKDHCAVLATRPVFVCEMWEQYERDLSRHAQVAPKGKRKVMRVHFDGADAGSKGGREGRGGGLGKEAASAMGVAKHVPQPAGEAYVGVTIPRAVKVVVAAAYVEEERRRLSERIREHQATVKAFEKRWVTERQLLAAKLMVQGVGSEEVAAAVEEQRGARFPPAPTWRRLLTTQELAELHARGLKEATEYHKAKRNDQRTPADPLVGRQL